MALCCLAAAPRSCACHASPAQLSGDGWLVQTRQPTGHNVGVLHNQNSSQPQSRWVRAPLIICILPHRLCTNMA